MGPDEAYTIFHSAGTEPTELYQFAISGNLTDNNNLTLLSVMAANDDAAIEFFISHDLLHKMSDALSLVEYYYNPQFFAVLQSVMCRSPVYLEEVMRDALWTRITATLRGRRAAIAREALGGCVLKACGVATDAQMLEMLRAEVLQKAVHLIYFTRRTPMDAGFDCVLKKLKKMEAKDKLNVDSRGICQKLLKDMRTAANRARQQPARARGRFVIV